MTTAHKVTADMVSFLNARTAELGSDYFFSRNARGTLTYFRRYSGMSKGGYSVARMELADHLYFAHKTTLGTLVDAAVRACLSEVMA